MNISEDALKFDPVRYDVARDRMKFAPILLDEIDFDQLGIVSRRLEAEAREAWRVAQLAAGTDKR